MQRSKRTGVRQSPSVKIGKMEGGELVLGKLALAILFLIFSVSAAVVRSDVGVGIPKMDAPSQMGNKIEKRFP